MTSPPADQDVRERLNTELDTSFFLQAGAGAGKTKTLVDRVVQLVQLGRAELRSIVAITFTEKAAGELRARIRAALAAARAQADHDQAERLDRALRQVDAAHIETIHAFASSLLRERPFDAGIDPNFNVLDALAADLDFTDAWHDWLWREQDPNALEAIQRALRFDLPLARLREAAQQLSRHRDLDPPPPSPSAPDPHETQLRWLATARSLRDDCDDAGWAQAKHVQTLVDWLETISTDGVDELSRQLLNPAKARNPGAVSDPVKLALKQRWNDFRAERESYATALRSEILNAVLAVLANFVRDDAERRKREGVLTYEDMLLEARNLLVESAAARAFFRARYSHILIDEFQDTDPLQAEIVLLLAARDDTADWRTATPAAGRLLVVGDPQQSIYRFRRADIDTYTRVQALFQQAAETMPGSAAEARLTVNFRSRPDLIGWFNATHSRVLKPHGDYPNAQAEHQLLDAHRDGDGAAVIVVPSARQDYKNIPEARAEEADTVARIIRAMVDGRTDFGQTEGNPPQFRDIAILVNNRTDLDQYIDELERAAIPYHHDSGRGFFTRAEIRDLTSILTALDDPSDEVAVVAALKSPPWAASDQELFEYSRARSDGRRSRFSLRQDEIPETYDGPLRKPLAELLELRAALRDRSLPDFVGYVLRASRLLESQFALPRGRLRAANLLMMVQRATDFAQAGDDSLRPFVRWLSERSSTDLSEAESATSEAADNVVRLLTIHQAKGLEFPIVILPKLASGNRDTSTFIVDREHDRIDFALGRSDARWQTEGFERAKQREAAYHEAEQRRLLYVATTRAKDWLVIPIFTAKKTIGFHAFFEDAIPNWLAEDNAEAIPEDAATRVRSASAFEPVPSVPRPTTPIDANAMAERWQEQHAAALDGGVPNVRALTPSSIGHDDVKREREDPPPEREFDDGGPEPAVARDAAMKRGSAIHRALQLANLDDPAETRRRTQQVCAEFGVPEDDVLDDVSRAIEHELLQRAHHADQRIFELPLVQHRDHNGQREIIEGVADLVFREHDSWVIVDFKSDRQPVDAEQLERYQQQVATYSEMLRASGADVHEAWLLFTHGRRLAARPDRQQLRRATPMTDSVRSPQQIRAELEARRNSIVEQMGSTERIARQHARGRLTIRERLDRLFDPGSFREIGTFAVSEVPAVRDRTPGDGKIGGWGEINGRPAAAGGDDVTVLHGSSSVVGGRRLKRVYDQALRQGVPFVYFGETGGARLPDALGSEGFSKISPDLATGAAAPPDSPRDRHRRRIVRRFVLPLGVFRLRRSGAGQFAGRLQPARDRDRHRREDLARRPRRPARAPRSHWPDRPGRRRRRRSDRADQGLSLLRARQLLGDPGGHCGL